MVHKLDPFLTVSYLYSSFCVWPSPSSTMPLNASISKACPHSLSPAPSGLEKALRLHVHGSHTEDLAPLLPSQLGTDDAVDAGADGVAGLVDEDAGVVVEADDGAVGALDLVLCADDDAVADVAALDLVAGGGGHALGGGAALLLDDADDAVADGCVALLADDHDTLDDGGARVVDAVEHRLFTRGTLVSRVLCLGRGTSSCYL